MAEFEVRPARFEDLPDAADAQYEALVDMHRRHGLPSPAAPPSGLAPGWVHLFESHGGGGFYVAEAGGRIIAVMVGILREGNWFLANFWCRPQWQGKGVGAALREAMRPHLEAAEVASVYASYDPPAMTTYQRLGMWARAPFFAFTLPEGRRIAGTTPWPGVVREPSGLSEQDLAAVGELDRAVRGCRRDLDQRHIAGRPGVRSYLFEREGRLLAYAHAWPTGVIGPVAAADPADLPAVLERAAAGLEGPISLRVPGENVTAVQWCLSRGFRLREHALFFSSRPFGQFDRYIITGPSLL
ncbi:MAG: GNAT family N-acetyltransferase [Bacillota bacterium]